jgi:hypothetical protein
MLRAAFHALMYVAGGHCRKGTPPWQVKPMAWFDASDIFDQGFRSVREQHLQRIRKGRNVRIEQIVVLLLVCLALILVQPRNGQMID